MKFISQEQMHDGAKLIYRRVSQPVSFVSSGLLSRLLEVLESLSPREGLKLYIHTSIYIHKWFILTILRGLEVFLFQPQAIDTIAQEQCGPTLLVPSKLAPYLNLKGESSQCTHTSCTPLTANYTHDIYLTGG